MKSVEQDYKKVVFFIEPEKHARLLRDFKDMKQNIQDYNLSEEEVDDIFSLIAQERGDL